MGELKLHKRIVYDVKANWKLIILNYNECLHCPVLHPLLNRLTDYLGADNQAPTPDYVGGSMGFRDGVETMSIDGVRRREYLPGLNAEQRKHGLLLRDLSQPAAQPASGLHDDAHAVAQGGGSHRGRLRVAFSSREMAKPGFQADDAIDFWDQTNREDWGISELSQLGISSRAYTPGPYSKREELLHAFDRIDYRGKEDAS